MRSLRFALGDLPANGARYKRSRAARKAREANSAGRWIAGGRGGRPAGRTERGIEEPVKMQRSTVLIIVALLAAVVAGWSLVWSAAARKTGAVLDAWIENESQLGRNWTCADRRIGGYPLDIELSCADSQFRGEVLGGNFAGSLGGFHALATVLQPDRIRLRLEPPFAGTTPDGDIDLRIEWSALNVVLEGRPNALTRLSVDGAQLTVTGSAGGLGAIDARTQSVQASVAPAPASGEAALDFQIALNGAVIPSLAQPLGLNAPLDAAFGGAIYRADIAGAGKLAERIERWRAGGGRLELKTAQLTSGAAKISASGILDVDEWHRPHGKLDAAFEGINPILERLGVDPQILAASSLLTRFLRNAPGNGGGPETTRLPLRLSDGVLSIGPIRTPVRLSPLY
jgi:hypothetical protein